MKISVAMTAYNGMEFLKQQIDSILCQLNPSDELVISIDPSTDGTTDYLHSLSLNDSRIKCIDGPGLGIIKNIENAISNCQGDIIFLADQDDVWADNKVETVMAEFENKSVILTMHDAFITDGALNIINPSFFEFRNVKKGFFHNIIKNSFIGCCMAFRSELKDIILPMSPSLPMHDQWIGIQALKHGDVSFISKPLLYYRRYGGNASNINHSDLFTMIKWRLNLIFQLIRRKK